MPIRRIYKQSVVPGGLGRQSLSALLEGLDPKYPIGRLTFYRGCADDIECEATWKWLREALSGRFGAQLPPFSLIAQPPLEGEMALSAMLFDPTDEESLIYQSFDDIRYVVASSASGRELVTGGIRAGVQGGSVFDQAVVVFSRLQSIIRMEKFNLSDLVRQWNYIEGIVRTGGGGQHYQEFNRARSRFYEEAEWLRGYPAATGIGMQAGGVMVEAEAFAPAGEKSISLPVQNPLQVAAHRYSAEVLRHSKDPADIPKFERARLIGDHRICRLLVSGTAAIRGQQSLAPGDALGQTIITMENIRMLLTECAKFLPGCCSGAGQDLQQLIVYLKNREDYRDISEYLSASYPAKPMLYLQADVCREELLVEVEAIGQFDNEIMR